MSTNPPKKNTDKSSKDFENELDEFFKERSHFRSVHVGDKTKQSCSKHREENEVSMQVSGCCMTGCHDCPWGYQAK